MFTALALLLAGLVSGAVSLIGVGVNHKSQQETNEANAEAVRETNEANLQAVRETNASNVEQANIAYQRSLPVNQVNDLMSAGMSRAGALNKLAGGGVYSAPALQTATAQAPQAQAPQMDLSKIGDIIERMGNIPSNVEQSELLRTQIDAAKADAEYKRSEEQRRQEQHDMQMDRERYDKWTRESMDSFFSKMQSAATEKNIQPGENDSFEQYVRKLGLSGDNDYKKLPVSAHERLFARYKESQVERRDQISSKDAHDMSAVQRDLARLELSEKQKTQITRLALLANQLEESNLTLDSANKDALIRQAGFENEKEAYEALMAAENLANRTRKDKERFLLNRSDSTLAHIGYTIEWAVDKISPFKNILSGK